MEITNDLLALAYVNVPTPKFIPDLSVEDAFAQAHILKALSDPTRLRILSLLSRHAGDIAVCEIMQCFKLEQPTISHHLKVLREAGLIDCHKKGLWAYYFVIWPTLERAKQIISALERFADA